ncbi:hypothetical protein HPB47_014540 [Ixodes persulcatus]|uniref:Uncharacterized protein n=1 Tax=Ixodes persulcatus TaxID=34615 RepID=A0AC60QXK9_IXOPE|nr:hypothetical protein HPB47_014540 [Ixodes persulcatus]
METREIISLGQALGLAGDDLRKWVEAERARERDAKVAEREATKERLDAERALASLEQETLQLKLRLAEAAVPTASAAAGDSGHDAKTCTKGSDAKEASCCVSLGSRKKHSHQASEPNLKIEDGDRNGIDVERRGALTAYDMPVLKGTLDGQAVSVLRDTGSNNMVVRRSLVPEAALTGTTAKLRLIDGRSIDVPEAQVDVTSPYFTGIAVAKCLDAPLYDVIVGNVPGSRDVSSPATHWKRPEGASKARVGNAMNDEEPEHLAPTSNLGNAEKRSPSICTPCRVLGTVQWFNVKNGYGFINHNDTREDIFVYQTAITRNNPQKVTRSVYEGETVQFDVVVGEKGREAANVTVPDDEPVQCFPYAMDRRRFRGRWFPRRSQRRPMPNPRHGVQGSDDFHGVVLVPDSPRPQPPPQRWRRPGRPGLRRYYRRSRGMTRSSLPAEDMRSHPQFEEEDEYEDSRVPRRPHRRFYGRYFRRRGGRSRSASEGLDHEQEPRNAPGSWRKPRPRSTSASPSRASAGRNQELSSERSSAKSVQSAPKKDGKQKGLDASGNGRADSKQSSEKKDICEETSPPQTEESFLLKKKKNFMKGGLCNVRGFRRCVCARAGSSSCRVVHATNCVCARASSSWRVPRALHQEREKEKGGGEQKMECVRAGRPACGREPPGSRKKRNLLTMSWHQHKQTWRHPWNREDTGLYYTAEWKMKLNTFLFMM